jgi:hypothetical protein
MAVLLSLRRPVVLGRIIVSAEDYLPVILLMELGFRFRYRLRFMGYLSVIRYFKRGP